MSKLFPSSKLPPPAGFNLHYDVALAPFDAGWNNLTCSAPSGWHQIDAPGRR
jgi:hypothetical protein